MKFWIALSLLAAPMLHSHCQMPCGIYHDDMVFDQIDQYVETMFKAATVMNDTRLDSTQNANTFVRWVVLKESASNEMADLITTYFLQQKIKPEEPDTPKRLAAAHRMLNLLMTIKQTADVKYVKAFEDEWEKFKLFFHIEGYECKMEQRKLKEIEEKKKEAKP